MANDKINQVLTVLAPFEYNGALREAAARFMVNLFENVTATDSNVSVTIEAAMYIITGIGWQQPQCIPCIEEIEDEQPTKEKEGEQ